MLERARGTSTTLWRTLTWGQRFSIFGVALASVLAIAGIGLWASTPSYGVLFSNLGSQDASAIVTQLGQDKVPYQLSPDGTTIMVPDNAVASERLKLAGAGLPQGGVVGLEIFDKQSMFQGDSTTQQINYTRGLEGELTRTIEQVTGVSSARVHIVIPPTQLFSSQQQDATASVLLRLNPGASLAPNQVAGIQHLVASAVQGLKPDGVTVVDGSGTILSQSSNGGVSTLGMTALTAQQNYARTVEAQLTAVLDTILGPNRAVVQVSDVMDWTQRDATSSTIAPQTKNSPIVQSHVTDNQATGPGSTVGGVPGVGSNVPTYGKAQSTATAYQQRQRSTDLTYATSTTISHVVDAPGKLQKLSVSVVLNGVSQREMGMLRSALATAVGLNPQRGDQLSLTSVPFDTTAARQAATVAQQAQQQAFILDLARWAALIVVPLILLFLLRRLLRAGRPQPGTVSVVEQTPLLDGSGPVLLPSPEPALSTEQLRRLQMQKDLIDMARDNPQEVAALISSWVDEGRSA